MFIEKYITNVYIFQDRVVARYEAETAFVREDASSSQLVDATKIYLDEVGGVKKKRVYGLGSRDLYAYDLRHHPVLSICLQLVNQFKNLRHRHKKIVESRLWKKEMSVMREEMMQQQREHLQTVQSLTTAFHAQISELIRGLPILPVIASESDVPYTEGSH